MEKRKSIMGGAFIRPKPALQLTELHTAHDLVVPYSDLNHSTFMLLPGFLGIPSLSKRQPEDEDDT